jgi:hypothetical protein
VGGAVLWCSCALLLMKLAVILVWFWLGLLQLQHVFLYGYVLCVWQLPVKHWSEFGLVWYVVMLQLAKAACCKCMVSMLFARGWPN